MRYSSKRVCLSAAVLLVALSSHAWALTYQHSRFMPRDGCVRQQSYTTTSGTNLQQSGYTAQLDGGIQLQFQSSGPTAPMDTSGSVINVMPQAAVTLAVPTSRWKNGCSATSAGMIFGYYDRNGYDNMYTGPTNGGVAPLNDLGHTCSLVTTEAGFDGRAPGNRGHVDDYWVATDTLGPDPWDGNWAEHTWGDCTADYLGTNQWKWDFIGSDGVIDFNKDGSTALYRPADADATKLHDYTPGPGSGMPQTALTHGLRLFAESRGYSVLSNYTQNIDALAAGGFSLNDFKAEIDAGRPVMVQVDGHSMVGVGYDTGNTNIYIHDTWDNSVHQMTWGATYSGMQHLAMTVINLAPSGSTIPEPACLGILGTMVVVWRSATRRRTYRRFRMAA